MTRADRTTKRRTCCIVLAVALLIAASGCGGDADDRGDAASVSEIAADAAMSGDSSPASGDTPTTTAAVGVSEPPPSLGDRFEWCAELQVVWDANHAAQLHLGEAVAAEEAALEAWQAATDDLDKAEAAVALDDATAAAADAVSAAAAQAADAAWLVGTAAGYHAHADSSPQGIVFARAWQAFSDTAGDVYRDAVEALHTAQVAEHVAYGDLDRVRADVDEREESEFPESLLYEPAEVVEAATYRLARATADLNVFTGRPQHLAVDTAVEELYDLADYYRDYTDGTWWVPSDHLARSVEDIGPVVDAAGAAHAEVRSVVSEDRLAEYDALVAVFEEQRVVFAESAAALSEAANARDAGLAALEAEQDAAYAAWEAAGTAHEAAADELWEVELGLVHTPAYRSFMASFDESCA